ncbi:hypothetical protein V0U79_12715 [Hyphobacterium sp. HN65]|uniref:BON domain-containing protein n=1 Tax=Hyphobacterium lacteum TaxID=3116575 RepID=A0ABU7LTK4_9PROT|nr:hypothetical protein [Hyphobacterium sp. HN65]MEE2527227.1 hypothetical protein [Hyphobacterium sp. HN65]
MTPVQRTLLTGLGVFLVFAIVVTNMTSVAPGRLEAHLQAAVDEALADRSFGWTRVTVDGQVATLRGRWPNEGVHQAAIEAIYNAEWSGGALAGGITRVIDESVAQEGDAPSQLTLILSSDGLEVLGIAPDASAREDITSLANVLFPSRVSIRMSTRDGDASTAGWTEAASQLLSAISRLEEGAGRLEADNITVYGVASNQAQADNVITAIEAAPATFHPVSWIRTDTTSVGTILTLQDCSRLMDAASLLGRLRFNPGSALLAASSDETLEHLAAVSRACPAAALTVSVRPVVAGDGEAETLAMARGESIRSALAERDIDPAGILVLINAQQDQLVLVTPRTEGDG